MTALSPYSAHFFTPEAVNSSWANMYHYIAPGSRVLDVGCSVGNFGEALQALKGCEVVGVDINETDIAVAATRISEAYVFDISAPGAQDLLGTFDVIVMADVIEHIPDPRAALTALHGLLREGGVLVYSIPNMGHMSVRLDLLEGRFPYKELGLLDRTHLHFYDRREVTDVFASSGFVITDERPTVSSYPREWMAQRLAVIGLASSDAFFDMLEVTEAHVYQYVGTAVPARGEPVPPPLDSRFVSPPDEILEQAGRVIAENLQLRAELDELRTWLVELKRRPLRLVANALRGRLGGRSGGGGVTPPRAGEPT
jgi:2-polyprenyl-3-methyl-5-hydroxy-6-metoxy-1,4-benzoquinol methylase